MVELLAEYGLFLAQAVTVVVAILIVFGGIASSSMSRRQDDHGHVKVTHLNETFEEMADILKEAVLTKDQLKDEEKAQKKKDKEEKKAAKKKKPDTEDKPEKKRVFVLDFDGDMQAGGVEALGTEITALLTMATEKDEVVIRLESPGGQVHAYGLAASQLSRIVDKKIPFTACVDKVAASGGYMMACVADKIVAAPFSILGSVGVVAELPNFNKIMKKYDVRANYVRRALRNNGVTIPEENYKDNLLEGNFKQPGWVTDITYLIWNNKRAYLSTILDLETRDWVAYKISFRNNNTLVIDTLKQAISTVKDPKGIILHSDQGSQYLSTEYKIICESNGILISHSKKGTPLDNAVIESFHSILKKETLYNNNITSLEEYINLVHEWMHFYNTTRRRTKKR